MKEVFLNARVNCLISQDPVPYQLAEEKMQARVQAIFEGSEKELIWFLEHPPLYTAGTSALSGDLLNPIFPVHQSGRGGQYTYHGPGQLICYVMLNLQQRNLQDIKKYILNLQKWCQNALNEVGIETFLAPDRVGLWVHDENKEKKLVAVGVRVSRWVTWHGFSINVNPDLSHFSGIIPCGLREYGVTSLKQLGYNFKTEKIIKILIKTFPFD